MPGDTTTRTAPKKPLRVRATRLGYYGDMRRREGDVFTIADESLFSEKWMERVTAKTPESTTTGAQELQRRHREIIDERTADRTAGSSDAAKATGDANVLGDDK